MLAAALVWAVGPWTPALACAVDSALTVAAVAESMPDCHRDAPEPAEPTGDRHCCNDVGTSCCLAAPGHVSTMAAAAPAGADHDGVVTLVAVTGPRCPAAVLDTTRLQFLDRGGTAPLRTTILRL